MRVPASAKSLTPLADGRSSQGERPACPKDVVRDARPTKIAPRRGLRPTIAEVVHRDSFVWRSPRTCAVLAVTTLPIYDLQHYILFFAYHTGTTIHRQVKFLHLVTFSVSPEGVIPVHRDFAYVGACWGSALVVLHILEQILAERPISIGRSCMGDRDKVLQERGS